jgi:hypothetical protein
MTCLVSDGGLSSWWAEQPASPPSMRQMCHPGGRSPKQLPEDRDTARLAATARSLLPLGSSRLAPCKVRSEEQRGCQLRASRTLKDGPHITNHTDHVH